MQRPWAPAPVVEHSYGEKYFLYIYISLEYLILASIASSSITEFLWEESELHLFYALPPPPVR